MLKSHKQYMGAWKVLYKPDSARCYCETAISLLTFCLRACFLPTTAIPTQFTDEQLDTLKDYNKSLTSVVDSSAADVEKTIKVLCEKHLGMGEGKISGKLISLRKYVSSLALREPGNPSILYNPDCTTLAFWGQNLSFSNLQLGLNQLIRDIWTRLLAFTKNKIEVVLPPLMSEDVRSTTVRKSFIDEITTNPPTLPLLPGMFECSGLPLLRPKGQVGDKEMFEVDLSASEEFFHRIKPIVKAITLLVHTTSSGYILYQLLWRTLRSILLRPCLFVFLSVFPLHSSLSPLCSPVSPKNLLLRTLGTLEKQVDYVQPDHVPPILC
ncbi:hypothetical protein BJ322DRAFT_1102821 [Thelephora terrestris]|uniref:Uncharacterized protein n=1 Tax=Thelephora terrestris TaxID=56493 RepID=A0A9P6HQ08_9AGAM|nr:hypothetical protein BJ322DRAFT_1102821 [Thelephora terrestris]